MAGFGAPAYRLVTSRNSSGAAPLVVAVFVLLAAAAFSVFVMWLCSALRTGVGT